LCSTPIARTLDQPFDCVKVDSAQSIHFTSDAGDSGTEEIFRIPVFGPSIQYTADVGIDASMTRDRANRATASGRLAY
jgi:hypothetical protein